MSVRHAGLVYIFLIMIRTMSWIQTDRLCQNGLIKLICQLPRGIFVSCLHRVDHSWTRCLLGNKLSFQTTPKELNDRRIFSDAIQKFRASGNQRLNNIETASGFRRRNVPMITNNPYCMDMDWAWIHISKGREDSHIASPESCLQDVWSKTLTT